MTITTTAKAKISISTDPFNADALQADYTAATWIEIGEVNSLGTFGAKGKDITSAIINDGYVRRLKGSIDSGTVNMVVNRDVFDKGQAAATVAANGWDKYLWKIELNDCPVETGDNSIFYFQGACMSAEHKLEGADQIVETTFSIGITGAVIEVPATIPITFTPAAGALPSVSHTGYSETIAATGGLGAVTYSLKSGALPSGITLNAATGVLSGTSAAGSYTFSIEADFTGAGSDVAAYTLTLT